MEATFRRLGSWCTEYIWSNHDVYHWTCNVSKFGFERTKWTVTMYFKYTAHISSNGSHSLTARVSVYWTYNVSKFGCGRTKWVVTMYSEYTAHLNSNGSHFLTTRFWCIESIRSVNLGMDGQSEWLLCILSIMHISALMEATFWRLGSWCTEHKVSKSGYIRTKWRVTV